VTQIELIGGPQYTMIRDTQGWTLKILLQRKRTELQDTNHVETNPRAILKSEVSLTVLCETALTFFTSNNSVGLPLSYPCYIEPIAENLDLLAPSELAEDLEALFSVKQVSCNDISLTRVEHPVTQNYENILATPPSSPPFYRAQTYLLM
jgi:hypothetical protein